jgi:hypothetical protein
VTEQTLPAAATDTGANAHALVGPFALACGAVALRLWFLVALRLDSDEPQHLHVAWGWSRGLVQYRDIFDNHLPLLHLFLAPLMAIVPENSDAFFFGRLLMLPFTLGCAWLVYAFARPLYGSRVATMAALIFSVMPPWLAKSTEVRNDTLWIFFWLLALVMLVRPRGPAWFAAGVAASLSLLASIKFAPLLLAHLLALLTERRPLPRPRELARLAAGALIPLAVICAMFAAAGAFHDMVYGTLLFNASAPVVPARRIGGAIGFAIVSVVMLLKGRRASHLTLFGVWYATVLLAFWPILTSRDFLPLAPLAAIGIALWWRGAALVPVAIAALWSCLDARPWQASDHWRARFVDTVVRTTGPDDYVVDLKGDAVFRQRADFFIYEDVGRALTERAVLKDDGPEKIVATGCCAAICDSTHLPPRTREFLRRHFIGDGILRFCGANVHGKTFEIGVPQTYAVVGGRNVWIDRTLYKGPRHLDAGTHTIDSDAPVTVVWWRAAGEWK